MKLCSEAVIKGLNQFGLSKKEVKIYLAARKLQIATIGKLASEAGLNRVSTYTYVSHLIEKGLLYEVQRNHKKFYSPEITDKLALLLDKKEWEMQNFLNSLDFLIESIRQISPARKAPNKPEVRYYEDLEGIRIVYNEILESREIFSFFSSDVFKIFPENMKKFAKAAKDNRIVLKEILDDSKSARSYVKKVNNRLHKVRFLKKNLKVDVDVLVYMDYVTFIDFKAKPPTSIIIKHKDFSDTFKSMFNIIWNLHSTSI